MTAVSLFFCDDSKLLFAAPVEGEGFEPSKPVATDLQSVPFDRSGTPPSFSTPAAVVFLAEVVFRGWWLKYAAETAPLAELAKGLEPATC